MENQEEFVGRAISYETYEMFRKRYHISKRKRVCTYKNNHKVYHYVPKTLDDIRQDIYNYEFTHLQFIDDGLYFNVPY